MSGDADLGPGTIRTSPKGVVTVTVREGEAFDLHMSAEALHETGAAMIRVAQQMMRAALHAPDRRW